MTARIRVLRIAALALLAVAPLSRAALFDDDEARKRIEATNQRLTQVQRAIEDRVGAIEVKMQGIVDLGNQMELLRGDLAKLRGNIEVLSYELEQAQKRQRDLYVDLDTRLRKLEGGPGAAAAGPAADVASSGAPVAGAGAGPPNAAPVAPDFGPSVGPRATPPVAGTPPRAAGTLPSGSGPSMTLANAAPAPGDPAAEQRAYDAALDQFKRADYAGAISSFNAFVKTYPRSPLAASAQYWIGNAQYARRDYRAAIAAQRTLLSAYPDSPKVPDAMLVIGRSQEEMGDTASARRTYEDLIAKHGQSDPAAKAKQRLGMR